MEYRVGTSGADEQRTGCVVVAVHEGRRLSESASRVDAASDGRLGKLLRGSRLEGRVGGTLLLHGLEGVRAERVLLVGVGRRGKMPPSRHARAAAAAAVALLDSGARDAAWHLGELEVGGRDAYWKARAAVLALEDASYRFTELRSEKPEGGTSPLRRLTIAVAGRREGDAARSGIGHGSAIASGIGLARDLGNLPGNVCTPGHLAERARGLARGRRDMHVRVLGEPDMKRLGMGALLAVARGSRESPRLITLEYRGGRKDERPIVLVGKGITFDSGGISIKPAASMDEMKFDMCGAASVLGAVRAAAEMRLKLNVIVLVPASENLPDGNACKPGDVVTTMAGQTVEILNTDAEGRLVLCDAITYAARYEPDVVVDVATLTGACVIALGNHATGLFANHEPLARALLDAGEQTGDRAWQLPLWEEYGEALESNFADVANVGGREAGAITAASFLERFARELRWAHLDIAGTAWRSGKKKGATGRPVALLAQYLLDRSRSRRRTRRR